MNKRIQELADEAAKYSATMFLPTGENGDDLFVKKFAELIIKDIGKIVSGLIVPETWEQDIGPYEKWNQALGHAALEIEQHFFGVEE